MDFRDVAQNRYTTKKYDPSKKIPADQVQSLKEVLRLSPSSINSQPWKFHFISDEKLKSELAEASFFNAPKINAASHLVVFGVIDSIEHFEKQIQENLPAGAVGYYDQFLKPLGENAVKSWMANQVYLSLGFFLSACATMGIDSTPMEGIEPDKYDEILAVPHYKTLAAVAIGYRDSVDANQPHIKAKTRLGLDEVVVSV